MPVSDSQYQDWLNIPGQYRNIIAYLYPNISGTETELKVTLASYKDFLPCLTKGFTYNESLSLSGQPSLAVGELSILNVNGTRDSWLDYVWTNRPVTIKLGDIRWVESDYKTILNGVMNSIKSAAFNTLSLIIQDKLQLLNTPITDFKLGGTTANKDVIVPFILGECANITAIVRDPVGGTTGTPIYQFSALDCEAVIEARAGCLPISGAALSGNWSWSPTFAPIGDVTFSVQGTKIGGVYSNKIAANIQNVLLYGGKYETRPTITDIDTANFSNRPICPYIV